MKTKVSFTQEQETLLIPLYAKAHSSSVFKDEKAREILQGVEYDFGRLKVPEKTIVTLSIRAKQLDVYAQQFIAAHPKALILHLGCGLDSRCLRVKHPEARWFDLDMADVIELRRQFYSESENYGMIASSVTHLEWVKQVPKEGRPTLIIAEGLLMYLDENEVRALILCMQNQFPGCEMVFDAFSRYTVERIQAHPSLRKTGATIRWGIDDAHEIEHWGEGIRMKEEWFFSQSDAIKQLGWFYRLMFRLTRSIRAAQRAQRLVYLEL